MVAGFCFENLVGWMVEPFIDRGSIEAVACLEKIAYVVF